MITHNYYLSKKVKLTPAAISKWPKALARWSPKNERTPTSAFLGNVNHRYRMLDWFGRLKQPTYNKSALGVVLHRHCFRQRLLRVTQLVELPYQRLHPLDWFGGNKQTHYSCQQLELSLRLHLFVYVLPVQTHPYFFRHLSNDDDWSIDINKKIGKYFLMFLENLVII